MISDLYTSTFTFKRPAYTNTNGTLSISTLTSIATVNGRLCSPVEADFEAFMRKDYRLEFILYCDIPSGGIVGTDIVIDNKNTVTLEILGIVKPRDGAGDETYLKVGLGKQI